MGRGNPRFVGELIVVVAVLLRYASWRMGYWSNGYDTSLRRMRQGFDSLIARMHPGDLEIREHEIVVSEPMDYNGDSDGGVYLKCWNCYEAIYSRKAYRSQLYAGLMWFVENECPGADGDYNRTETKMDIMHTGGESFEEPPILIRSLVDRYC